MSTKTVYLSPALAALIVSLVLLPSATRATSILVYDHNSTNFKHWAATAAQNINPAATLTVQATFNSSLASQTWDVVLVDCPSSIPTGGWQPLVNYINNGGRVVMSFWDWSNVSGQGDPEPQLLNAFGITSATFSGFSTVGRTLNSTGLVPGAFAGVTMPNSSWDNNRGDDGDAFTLAAGTTSMATMSGITGSVMAYNSTKRTVAAFVIDEAGATWAGNGSGVQLWTNLYSLVVPEPATWITFGVGILGLLAIGRRRFTV